MLSCLVILVVLLILSGDWMLRMRPKEYLGHFILASTLLIFLICFLAWILKWNWYDVLTWVLLIEVGIEMLVLPYGNSTVNIGKRATIFFISLCLFAITPLEIMSISCVLGDMDCSEYRFKDQNLNIKVRTLSPKVKMALGHSEDYDSEYVELVQQDGIKDFFDLWRWRELKFFYAPPSDIYISENYLPANKDAKVAPYVIEYEDFLIHVRPPEDFEVCVKGDSVGCALIFNNIIGDDALYFTYKGYDNCWLRLVNTDTVYKPEVRKFGFDNPMRIVTGMIVCLWLIVIVIGLLLRVYRPKIAFKIFLMMEILLYPFTYMAFMFIGKIIV